jgi:hypothetical protein
MAGIKRQPATMALAASVPAQERTLCREQAEGPLKTRVQVRRFVKCLPKNELGRSSKYWLPQFPNRSDSERFLSAAVIGLLA